MPSGWGATRTSSIIESAATKSRSFTFVMPHGDRGKGRAISPLLDSKLDGGNIVLVRVRPEAPIRRHLAAGFGPPGFDLRPTRQLSLSFQPLGLFRQNGGWVRSA